jgi:hypothetical protein
VIPSASVAANNARVPDARLEDENVRRITAPIVDELGDVRRIDVGDLRQRRRGKRDATVFPDQVRHLRADAGFKNGDGLVFHR